MRKESILDVRMLPPQGKHQHIFETLENIAEGEDIILVNDHDPKPLYYQMNQMYPDVFSWTYLQEGENDVWKIKISLKPRFSKTVREVVLQYPPSVAVFKKHRIDYCCRGNVSFMDACTAKGLDGEEVLAEIRQSEAQGNYPLRFQDWKLSTICDFIENNHHNYIRKNTPLIAQLVSKVTKVHHNDHAFLVELNRTFFELSKDLMSHLEKEEADYFPLIKQYEQSGMLPDGGAGLKEELENEHREVGDLMAEIRELTNNYELPAGACASFELTYKFLKEFEDDLHQHIHLENNILFPKVKEGILV